MYILNSKDLHLKTKMTTSIYRKWHYRWQISENMYDFFKHFCENTLIDHRPFTDRPISRKTQRAHVNITITQWNRIIIYTVRFRNLQSKIWSNLLYINLKIHIFVSLRPNVSNLSFSRHLFPLTFSHTCISNLQDLIKWRRFVTENSRTNETNAICLSM